MSGVVGSSILVSGTLNARQATFTSWFDDSAGGDSNGDGGQTRDYVFVGDLVRANVALATHTYCGPMNFGTGIETDVNELFGHIAAAAGAKQPAEHGPAKPGEQRRSVISPALAGEVIGWRPETPLAEGISQTVDFFRSKAAA